MDFPKQSSVRRESFGGELLRPVAGKFFDLPLDTRIR
jgi:hypothetical protein